MGNELVARLSKLNKNLDEQSVEQEFRNIAGYLLRNCYIKQNDIEDYTLPEYNEAVEKIASVLNIKRAANLTKDTRQLVNNVNNLILTSNSKYKNTT